MKRILWLCIITAVGIVMLYLSRFWIWSLWPRSGLFGVAELRPQGGLLATWLRGTDFAPFELLIWAVGVFLILTYLQKLYDRLSKPPK